jgi:PTH1 family peptidyl-tRNA hydrolase
VAKIKLLVGLGNIGDKYAGNRHNIGFMAIDEVAKVLNLDFSLNTKLHAFIAKGNGFYLIKPTTFMNDSGIDVKAVMDYFDISVNEIAVLVDDIDRPYGALRIKKNGSSGGHNGLKSIAAHIDTEEFMRIRFGVDRTEHEHNAVFDHVLGNFTKEQLLLVQPALDNAVNASIDLLNGEAINQVSTKYNL